ncbi:mRNA triphosphatase CET1 [Amniculicola lignicola CBS 123094]|uniref:mRNA-capping enzyme subunit beta n=1 Tax=Amniculicola lignicola CBS 123094 TaxID=1392246 RepID=A0A6A5X3F4_9PLEO|nr:mRNA triphosphatase CET1 [Amniculicola lignicola CBS 123094]
MNIAALVNPTSVAPRRSSSNPHLAPPSPATSTAKLPSPPLSMPKAAQHKRKRRDPKPIWAVQEHEVVNGETLQDAIRAREQQQQPAQPSPTPQAQAPPPPPPSMPRAENNGAPPAMVYAGLQEYERPVSNDPEVYNEIARKVCDFLWLHVVDNMPLRQAIELYPDAQVEIEARWGQIFDQHSRMRLSGVHETECVVRKEFAESLRFESTMSLDQHKKMNNYLNKQVMDSNTPHAMRAKVEYKHIREIDTFYGLDKPGLALYPPPMQKLIQDGQRQPRVRVTLDGKTGEVIAKIIKVRVANLEISSPQTEWDYRIGINLEIKYPGEIAALKPVQEPGKTADEMKRSKDRVSYSWLGAYQVDLTQVSQGPTKNHELELELNADLLIAEAMRIKQGHDSKFEILVAGMMNNLRVLSREMTPPPAQG